MIREKLRKTLFDKKADHKMLVKLTPGASTCCRCRTSRRRRKWTRSESTRSRAPDATHQSRRRTSWRPTVAGRREGQGLPSSWPGPFWRCPRPLWAICRCTRAWSSRGVLKARAEAGSTWRSQRCDAGDFPSLPWSSSFRQRKPDDVEKL